MEILGDGKAATQKHCELCGEYATNRALCKKHYILMCRDELELREAIERHQSDNSTN